MAGKAKRARISIGTLAFLLALTGCAWPTRDQDSLKKLRAEADAIVAVQTADFANLNKNALPPVIAGLKPEFVSASRSGVEIITKPGLDGGWGYYIPAKGAAFPKPRQCYTPIGQGVYWFKPC